MWVLEICLVYVRVLTTASAQTTGTGCFFSQVLTPSYAAMKMQRPPISRKSTWMTMAHTQSFLRMLFLRLLVTVKLLSLLETLGSFSMTLLASMTGVRSIISSEFIAYRSNSSEQAVIAIVMAKALSKTFRHLFPTYTTKRVRVLSCGAENLVANDALRLG